MKRTKKFEIQAISKGLLALSLVLTIIFPFLFAGESFHSVIKAADIAVEALEISIDVPVKYQKADFDPQIVAVTPNSAEANIGISDVIWESASMQVMTQYDVFQPDTVYSVTIILSAESGFTFYGIDFNDIRINGMSVMLINNTNDTITIKVFFAMTDPDNPYFFRDVNIEVTPPTYQANPDFAPTLQLDSADSGNCAIIATTWENYNTSLMLDLGSRYNKSVSGESYKVFFILEVSNMETYDYYRFSQITVNGNLAEVTAIPGEEYKLRVAYLFNPLLAEAPLITSEDHFTTTPGASSTFQVTASGEAPHSFSLSGSGLPSGVSIDPDSGLLTVAATVPSGIYTFNIDVDNGFGQDTQVFTLTVPVTGGGPNTGDVAHPYLLVLMLISSISLGFVLEKKRKL